MPHEQSRDPIVEPAGGPVFRSSTARAEAFSDGVLAIVVTLLVLDLTVPVHKEGHLLVSLARQWPAYVGYLASFLYVGVIWLNHHATFARVRSVNSGLQFANLGLLFTTALIPFPTAVVSETLTEGIGGVDARTAIAAAPSPLMSGQRGCRRAHGDCAVRACRGRHVRELAGALRLSAPSSRRSGQARNRGGLLWQRAQTRDRRDRRVCVAGLLGTVIAPVAALAIFVLLPIFYATSSEGLMSSSRRPVIVPPAGAN